MQKNKLPPPFPGAPPYPGPPRDQVLIGMPSYTGIEPECVGGLLQCWPYYDRPLFFKGMSNIALARNEIAHIFLEKTKYEWLVMIDSDTAFTIQDWFYLWEGTEDVVCCEYARKVLGMPPVQFGLGFTRVHRRVFQKIKDLTTEDGQERVNRFYHKGELFVDYFPNGATSDARWIGEDQGFFMWAAMTDSKPRLETRTRLGHIGRMTYGYPDQVPGYKIVTEEDGAQ